jgi:hypothetical protein
MVNAQSMERFVKPSLGVGDEFLLILLEISYEYFLHHVFGFFFISQAKEGKREQSVLQLFDELFYLFDVGLLIHFWEISFISMT